jgi:hypothetical protein
MKKESKTKNPTEFQNPIAKSLRDTINTWYTNTWLCVHAFQWMKSGGVKLVLCAKTSSLSQMMRSCKCFFNMWVKYQLSHITVRTGLLITKTRSNLELYKGRSPSNGKLSDVSFYIDSQKSAHRKFKK